MNPFRFVVTAWVACAILTIASPLLNAYEGARGSTRAAESAEPKEHHVLLLEGSPFDRGVTHGKELKSQIRRLVELWKADIGKQYKTTAEQFVEQFVQKTNYVGAMERWTPDVLDEIKGIAAGAEMDFQTIFVFQFLDEYWAQGRALAAGRCSSLGFRKEDGQPACVAQNNDLETFRDGFQVVLRIRIPDSDLELLVHSNAGCIGWNGMNNKSVGICVNTVSQLANCRDGLPVNCVIRGVLMQRTEEDAVAFVKQVKHASGANYIVGGPNGVHCFECSANQVVQFRPHGQDRVVWHTNHAVASDDFTVEYRTLLAKGEAEPGHENSRVRLESLERRLGRPTAGTRLDLIKETLASKDSIQHPVCGSRGRGGTRFFTFAASILLLSEEPEFYVTYGPPDDAQFERFVFSSR